MFKLELTKKEAQTLVRLLSTKVKEIHAWRVATGSLVRDKEYAQVLLLLKKISYDKGG